MGERNKAALATTQNYFAGRGYPLTLQYFRLRRSIGPNIAR